MQNPAPAFSVYDLYTKQKESTEIFYEKRRVFADWCANVERTIVQYELNIDHVFVSFQSFDYFMSVRERYQQMAEYVDNIWIFGTPAETATLPKVKSIHYVHLQAEDNIASEWFLIVNHPTFARSLSAIETPNDDMPKDERYYRAILTDDKERIQPVYDQLLRTYVTASKQ